MLVLGGGGVSYERGTPVRGGGAPEKMMVTLSYLRGGRRSQERRQERGVVMGVNKEGIKAHIRCVSLNSRPESNKQEEKNQDEWPWAEREIVTRGRQGPRRARISGS